MFQMYRFLITVELNTKQEQIFRTIKLQIVYFREGDSSLEAKTTEKPLKKTISLIS